MRANLDAARKKGAAKFGQHYSPAVEKAVKEYLDGTRPCSDVQLCLRAGCSILGACPTCPAPPSA